MNHMFDAAIAVRYGVNAAILFQNIAYWCEHSRANGKNYYDGLYWTFNSVKALQELFPYMTANQINSAIKKLVDAGLVVKGNYNRSAYDRTTWYAVTEKGKSIYEKSEMDFEETPNQFPENQKPIPDINTDINTDRGTRKRFTPPTLDEVRAYAREKGYRNFSPDTWFSYYQSNGWKVGRDTMKDWKASVRYWVAKDAKPKAREPSRTYEDADYENNW